MNNLAFSLSFIASTLFLFLYLRQYSTYFPFRRYAWFPILFLFAATTLTLFNFSWLNDYIHYRLLVAGLTYFIAFPLIFDSKLVTSVYLTFNFILKTYCTFLFFASLFAIAYDVSLTLDWITQSTYYHYAHFLSYLVASISMVSLDRLLLKKKMKEFFSTPKLVVFILVIQIILLLNLAVTSAGQSYPFQTLWFNFEILILSVSTFVIYFLTRYFTANMSYLVGYKYHNQALEKQLNIQLNHYVKYENQIQAFLKFRHDYDKTLHSISMLLAQQNYTSIHEVLAEEIDTISKKVIDYHKYSNHMIADAILNDYAQKLFAIECQLNATTYISLEVNLSDLDIIKLFYNIMDNIYEAVLKVNPRKDLSVTIDSAVHENFQMITFTNTMSMTHKKNHFATSKKNTVMHGFGLQIINEILNNAGGFATHKVIRNMNVHYFQLTLHLPLTQVK